MSSSSKAGRRYNNVLCSEATKVIAKKPFDEERLIAQQEAAMWAEYRAWLYHISHPPIHDLEHSISLEEAAIADDEADVEDIHLEGKEVVLDVHSRFEVTDSGPAHAYPTGKAGQTTGVRRYLPSAKKSDSAKIYGKLKGPSYQQLKKAGIPLEPEDLSSFDNGN